MSDTSTVLAGGLEISSNHEQAADMVSVLSRPKESAEPRILIEKGKEVDSEREEEIKVSEAAAALGKKGGKAAAEKKAEQKTQGLVDEHPQEETETEEKPEKEESPEEKDAEAKKEALGKPRHDPKARMLEATRKEAEAKRDRDRIKAEKDALQAKHDALQRELEAARAPKEPQKPAEAPTKPVRASYQSDEDYIEAIAAHKAEEKVKEYEAKRETERQIKEYTGTLDAILGKNAKIEKEYAKTDPEYLSKVSDEVKAIALKPSFALDLHEIGNNDNVIADELFMADKMAPAIKLHFSENPEDLERIRNLQSFQEVQVEMRLLARTLNGAASTVTVPKGSSKAKPPVQPVTGSPVASEPDIFGDIDFDTFAQRRLKKKA